jgi:hypothetical protein
MKKLHKIIILTFLITLAFAPVLAFGQGTVAPSGSGSIKSMLDDAAGAEGAGYGQADEFSMAKMLGTVVRMFLSLVGIIFLSYTIYGGFIWMTAAGNDEKVSKSKNIIRDGIIGMIIILGVWTIYYTVTQFWFTD